MSENTGSTLERIEEAAKAGYEKAMIVRAEQFPDAGATNSATWESQSEELRDHWRRVAIAIILAWPDYVDPDKVKIEVLGRIMASFDGRQPTTSQVVDDMVRCWPSLVEKARRR